jgi:ribosomal protein S18 acetylase RimI-like enzyme
MRPIVPAHLDDATIILEIQKRAFAEEGRLSDNPDIPPLTEGVDAVREHIRSQTVLVVRDDDRIVGSARGIVDGTVCVIRGVSVEPALQGQGIGSSLLRAIEAAHPGVARFELTTNTVMESNVRFYERHGYRVRELTRYTDKITLAQMMKTAVPNDA